jgi:hypothetical protein
VLAPLALRFPFEMLDGIRDIHVPTGNAGFDESLVKSFTCRSDERMTRHIFLIARLLADKQDGSLGGSLAENRLGGVFV